MNNKFIAPLLTCALWIFVLTFAMEPETSTLSLIVKNIDQEGYPRVDAFHPSKNFVAMGFGYKPVFVACDTGIVTHIPFVGKRVYAQKISPDGLLYAQQIDETVISIKKMGSNLPATTIDIGCNVQGYSDSDCFGADGGEHIQTCNFNSGGNMLHALVGYCYNYVTIDTERAWFLIKK